MSQNLDFIHSAQRTIGLERDAVDSLLARIGDDFVKACELLLAGKGRVVVVGMGKSGHIGKKEGVPVLPWPAPALPPSSCIRPRPATATWA